MKYHWTQFDKTIRRLGRSHRADFLKPGVLDGQQELEKVMQVAQQIRLHDTKNMQRYKWLTVSAEIPEKKRIAILRRKLRGVESGIIRITGANPQCYRWWRNSHDLNKLDELLAVRCYLLNQMFRATPAAVERFEKVNAMLHNLTEQLYAKTASVYRGLISNRDLDFDDDFEIEGTLSFNYNYRDSVLQLEDDRYYKSNFELMLWVLDAVIYEEGWSLFEVSKSYSPNDTPAMSDKELGLGNTHNGTIWTDGWPHHPALEHIRICPALHDICTQRDISIPDLLRMNDFWCEVTVKHQHFITQDGSRMGGMRSSSPSTAVV